VVISGEAMTRELFYVAASRGREHVAVITSDKAGLQDSVGQSGARLSASELVRKMHANREHASLREARGYERGIQLIADGARHSGTEWDEQRNSVHLVIQHHPIRHEPARQGLELPQIKQGHNHGISW
jgi:hypothetical protein